MANIPINQLPREYDNMTIPKDFRLVFGSKNLTRLLTFVDHYEINNADYDAIMAIGPQRQPNESDEDLKLRGKLRSDLSKYKQHFYKY